MSTSPNKTSVCDELGEQVVKNMIYSYGEKVMLCKYNNCEKNPRCSCNTAKCFRVHMCVQKKKSRWAVINSSTSEAVFQIFYVQHVSERHSQKMSSRRLTKPKVISFITQYCNCDADEDVSEPRDDTDWGCEYFTTLSIY